MKLLILGAAGRTGSLLVDLALAAGHEVTAFVHSSTHEPRPGVRTLAGDARDPAAILEAVKGQDAVIDALGGHLPFLKTTVETDTAANVLSAMRSAGVRRLLAISTLGEGDSTANVHDFYKHFFMTTVLRGVMADKAGLEAVIQHSDLDWTIVRAAGLVEGEPRGIHLVEPRPSNPEAAEKVRFLTRADLARFLIEQVSRPDYIHQIVGVAGPHS